MVMVTTIEIIGIAAGVGAIAGLAYYAHKKSKVAKTVSTVTQSSVVTAPATAQATGATASYPQTQTSTAPPYTATQAAYTTQQSPWSQVQQYVNILKQSPAWALETVSQSYESWASSGAWYTKLHASGVTPLTAILSASTTPTTTTTTQATAQSTGATATYPQTQTYGPPHWPYYPKPYQPSRYPGLGRWIIPY